MSGHRGGPLTVGIAALIGLAVLSADAQQEATQRATGTVNEGVRAVLVDVVVRDKRGTPVRDLTQADFDVLEDGVPQKIGSFTPIFDGVIPASVASSSATTAAPAVGSPAPVDAGPAVTALVFDRLSPEARKLAVEAAESYLGSKPEAPSYIGVFGIDVGLTPYAQFTKNVRVLRQALGGVGNRSSSGFGNANRSRQTAESSKQGAYSVQGTGAAAPPTAGPGAAGAVGTGAADALFAQIQASMARNYDLIERDQQGYSTTDGLFAIINAMRGLPGRKSLVLFSEGMAIPPAVQRLFLGVIDAANRANVTIYAMDAAGLRAESEQAMIRDQVNQTAAGGGGILAGNTGNAPLTKALELNEDVLRQDPHNGLGELVQDTGGLLFENTNNLRQGFDRIESDLRNYYLVGYTPSNDAYDGRFRTIEVRVKRPGVTVAARKGYFGVRDSGGLPINTWEAPALGALEQKPVPNAFPVRAGALLFPERERPGLVPVVVDLKTAPLTFQPAADGKNYTSDFEVLVRFVDGQNQVIRKVSQHYEISGPLAEIDRAKQGEVVFYREPELPPGVYSMEAVVHDTPSGKSSVRFSTVDVPKVDAAKLRMSSLVLVKRGERISEKDRRADNPLLVNDVVVYPNLGEPISKSAKEIGFYFVVYPGQGATPAAVIELLQNSKPVAQVPMPLSGADASGRIQQVGRLPLDAIAPDTYELRVIVKQGGDQVFRSTLLRIVE
jgi:VWFA-related protein